MTPLVLAGWAVIAGFVILTALAAFSMNGGRG